MYIINPFQLTTTKHGVYLNNLGKGIKINKPALIEILQALSLQPKLEICEQTLTMLADAHQYTKEALTHLLANTLGVIKPALSHKFKTIEINSDDAMIADLLKSSFEHQYEVLIRKPSELRFQENSLALFYRTNYTAKDFASVYAHLTPSTYLVTAGALHKLLIIDNLYVKDLGLPSHLSNLNQLMTYYKSDMPSTKNNWLLYYRELVRNQSEDELPAPVLNACQKAYIAYGLYQFMSQFADFWRLPTSIDAINWQWQMDLTTFHVHTEVVTNSPFSQMDMQLNLDALQEEDVMA